MSFTQELKNIKSKLATSLNLPFLYRHKSYAQEGEDRIIFKSFSTVKTGFYVDIGAYHPFRFSNTQLLYEHGWHGINIEPTPGAIKSFHQTRKRDTNLPLAISNQKQTRTFFCFEEPALNTFDTSRAQTIINSKQSKQIAQYKLTTHRLDEVLNQYLPPNQPIHLMNIDVEGLELEVIRSNDWEKYLPHIIAIENFHYLPTFHELEKYGYIPFAQTYSTQMFKLKDLKL